MTYTWAEQIRYWLPLVSAFLLIVKAYSTGKKNIATFCDRLLDNHLSHIEAATTATVTETQRSNVLLEGHAEKLEMVQNTLVDHQTKNLQVWQGVLESLTILKERTRNPRKVTTPKRKARNVR
jgi:hypothetical protein